MKFGEQFVWLPNRICSQNDANKNQSFLGTVTIVHVVTMGRASKNANGIVTGFKHPQKSHSAYLFTAAHR